jgi:hypothetical protein
VQQGATGDTSTCIAPLEDWEHANCHGLNKQQHSGGIQIAKQHIKGAAAAAANTPASTAQPAVAPAARLPAVMRHCGTPAKFNGALSTALASAKAGTCLLLLLLLLLLGPGAGAGGMLMLANGRRWRRRRDDGRAR